MWSSSGEGGGVAVCHLKCAVFSKTLTNCQLDEMLLKTFFITITSFQRFHLKWKGNPTFNVPRHRDCPREKSKSVDVVKSFQASFTKSTSFHQKQSTIFKTCSTLPTSREYIPIFFALEIKCNKCVSRGINHSMRYCLPAKKRCHLFNSFWHKWPRWRYEMLPQYISGQT